MNRAECLSDSQKKYLSKISFREALIKLHGGVMMVVAIFTTGIGIASIGRFHLVISIMMMMFGVYFFTTGREVWRMYTVIYELKNVTVSIQKVDNPYRIIADDITFYVSNPQFYALNDGGIYTIYYDAPSNKILTVDAYDN